MAYEWRPRTLHVLFSDGSHYAYQKVPRRHWDTLRSPLTHAGEVFNSDIRNRYNFQRVPALERVAP